MTAISIHIGLNQIDPKHYGDEGTLAGCHNDANAMQALAKSQGFKAGKPMLDKEATSARVIKAISETAGKLESGDSLFLTYSGHGSQVEDINTGDEDDGLDETWCLYDRMLLDDELAALWATFKPGVRIIMLSDSCHSGSVSRAAFRPPGSAPRASNGRFRMLPEKLRKKAATDWAGVYRAVQMRSRKGAEKPIKASVILISGCEDHQLSSDGDDFGLFTSTLLKVWNKGKFTGSSRLLRAAVLSHMPPQQQPRYSLIGAANSDFESAPALRPAPKSAPATKKAGASPAATRTRGPRETPLQFVLRELEIMGLRGAHAGTDITKFFAECEKIDSKNSWPSRTAIFRELYLASFSKLRLSFADLIKGRYRTPQMLANLA